MLGQERTILPLIARDVFGLTAFTAILSFILAFGVTKAITNLAAGALADRYGRKPVLVAGWLVGAAGPAAADLGARVGLGDRRERPARDQPGAGVVQHRDHEDRSRRPGSARPAHSD